MSPYSYLDGSKTPATVWMNSQWKEQLDLPWLSKAKLKHVISLPTYTDAPE